MKKLFKKLAGLMMGLLVVAGLAGIGANNDAPVKADAASIPASTKFYLTPNSNWKQSNARYAIYFFGNGDGWVSMTKVAGQTDLYEGVSPAGKSFKNLIFCRMNPNTTANNWDNKWNQTADLTFNGTSNHYTVKAGTWDKGGGTWSIWPKPEVVETHEVKYYNGEEYVTTKTGSEFENVTVTSTDPSKSFAGWATKDGDQYSSGSLLTADITVYARFVWKYSLCGTVAGGDWNNAVPLYYDEATQSYVSNEIILNANEEFKIRKDENWDPSYGYNECTSDKSLIDNANGNAKVKTTGTYIITFKGSKWTIAPVVSAQNFAVNYYNDANGEPIKTVEVAEGGTAALDFVYQENNKFLGWYLDAGLTQACTTAPTVTGDLNLYGKYVPCTDYTIYVKATKALNVYAWNSVNGVGNAEWPGTASTLVAEGIYAYTVQAEFGYDKVIFNDGTGQTADLPLTASVYTVAADWNFTTAPAAQVVAHIENDSFDLAEVIPALGLAEGTVTYTATSVGYSLITLKEGTLVFDSAAHIAKEDKQPALEAYIAGVNTCTDYTNVNAYKALAAGLDTTATVADVDYDWDGTREGSTYVIDSAIAWESDFLVTEDANAEGHFSISADFKAQIGYPNTEERLYGFVFYWDDANWITVYAKYVADRPTRMTEVQVVGCVGGHDPAHWTNWNTYWMCDDHHLYGQGIEADPAKGFTLSVEYNNGKFIPSVDGFVNASYDSTGKGGWTSVCDLASRFPSDIWTKECKVGYFVKAGANNLVTVSDIEVSSLDGETVDTVHNYYKVKASTNNVTITEYVDVQVSIQDKLDYMEVLAAEQAEEETGVNTVTSVNNKSKGITVMLIVGIVALTSVAAYYFLGKKRFAR